MCHSGTSGNAITKKSKVGTQAGRALLKRNPEATPEQADGSATKKLKVLYKRSRKGRANKTGKLHKGAHAPKVIGMHPAGPCAEEGNEGCCTLWGMSHAMQAIHDRQRSQGDMSDKHGAHTDSSPHIAFSPPECVLQCGSSTPGIPEDPKTHEGTVQFVHVTTVSDSICDLWPPALMENDGR